MPASTSRPAARDCVAERARRIRAARRHRGLTQRELAAFLGCSQSALSRIERGTLAPAPDLLPRLAAVLGLPGEALGSAAAGIDEEEQRRWRIWALPLLPEEKLLLLALLDGPAAASDAETLAECTGLGTGTVRDLTDRLLAEGLLRRDTDRADRGAFLVLAADPGAARR